MSFNVIIIIIIIIIIATNITQLLLVFRIRLMFRLLVTLID